MSKLTQASKPHIETIVLVFVFYILPLILNVIIFRTESPSDVPPTIVAVSTLIPVFNWTVPIVYGGGLILETIGGWILP